jgi:hypothetical protein
MGNGGCCNTTSSGVPFLNLRVKERPGERGGFTHGSCSFLAPMAGGSPPTRRGSFAGIAGVGDIKRIAIAKPWDGILWAKCAARARQPKFVYGNLVAVKGMSNQKDAQESPNC